MMTMMMIKLMMTTATMTMVMVIMLTMTMLLMTTKMVIILLASLHVVIIKPLIRNRRQQPQSREGGGGQVLRFMDDYLTGKDYIEPADIKDGGITGEHVRRWKLLQELQVRHAHPLKALPPLTSSLSSQPLPFPGAGHTAGLSRNPCWEFSSKHLFQDPYSFRFQDIKTIIPLFLPTERSPPRGICSRGLLVRISTSFRYLPAEADAFSTGQNGRCPRQCPWEESVPPPPSCHGSGTSRDRYNVHVIAGGMSVCAGSTSKCWHSWGDTRLRICMREVLSHHSAGEKMY